MKSDNIKFNRYSGVIAIILCFVVVLSTMTFPVFAAESSNLYLPLETGTYKWDTSAANKAYLWVDENTPLTINYLRDNPGFSVKFYNKDKDVLCVKIDNIDKYWSVQTSKGSTLLSYELFDGYSNESGSNSQLYIYRGQADDYSSVNIDCYRPKPMNTIIKCVSVIATAFLTIASTTMAYVWSEPLVLIVFLITLLFVGIFVCKKLSKGV